MTGIEGGTVNLCIVAPKMAQKIPFCTYTVLLKGGGGGRRVSLWWLNRNSFVRAPLWSVVKMPQYLYQIWTDFWDIFSLWRGGIGVGIGNCYGSYTQFYPFVLFENY